MTEAEFKTQLQLAQDMLEGMANQRNAAQNEAVQLNAQLMALQRKVKEMEAKLAEADEPELPLSNGHATATQPTAVQ